MSSHSFPKIDQKEYLKKYLSGDKAKKKKKDKKHKKSKVSAKLKIFDDDNHIETGLEIDEELLLTGDDAPQIVGEYIEDMPADKKVPKWKSIVIKDEPEEDLTHLTGRNDGDLWGRKTNDVKVKQEFSSVNKMRSNSTPDNSPIRKKDRRRKSTSVSPTRRQRSSSPPRTSSKKDNTAASKRKTKHSINSPDRRQKIKTEILSPVHINSSQKIQNSRKDLTVFSYPKRSIDSDQTPPRRKHSSPSLDVSSIRNNRNSDRSPSRKEKRTIRSPHNSPHYQKNSSQFSSSRGRNFDRSPQRKSKNSISESKLRSPAHKRKDSSDQSPTRRGASTNQSPPQQRKNINKFPHDRYKRDSDQSPVGKAKYSSEISPPPQKNRQRTQTPDNSPAKSSRKAPDLSPPRRRRNSDQLPPRQKRKSPMESRIKLEKLTPDLSPQRSRPSRWEKSLSPPPTHKPKPNKTLEGKNAGLQNAQDLQIETKERRKKEEILFKTMSSDISGRNAEVQIRSTGRKGRRAREAADEDPEERRRKEEYEEKKKQQYDRWGKGLKQIEDHKNHMLQQEYESSKPLARYANDEDLERHLKEQERSEDPMLNYMRQKRKEKEKQSGKPQVPLYEGPYPENRFGIRPGYRWDGVDRSNGYEKKYFAVQNEKQAAQEEAYKYSVEDM